MRSFLSFRSSNTRAFQSFITNYSASSSISWVIIFIIFSGCDRLNSFFSTIAINFSYTEPIYSQLLSSNQGLMFLSSTTLFESFSQSIGYCQRSYLFWGIYFSNSAILLLSYLSSYRSPSINSGSFSSYAGF